MIEYEDECVGCPPEMGCMGSACPNKRVAHYYCDECGEERTLRQYGEKQLCENCLMTFVKDDFPVVEGSEI